MDADQREEILRRYRAHSRRFEQTAARRAVRRVGSVIYLAPLEAAEEPQPSAPEIEVLQFVADGLTNREIAERLLLSEETVKSHARHLYVKLQVRGRTQAVASGFRLGLIV